MADAGNTQAGLYQFQVRPGPVTFCRLAEYDGRWKMLIAPGEIIPSDETLAGTWAWVEVRDTAGCTARWWRKALCTTPA